MITKQIHVLLCLILLFCIVPAVSAAAEPLYAIVPKYDVVYSFTEGLAAIKRDGKWGFIDRTGNEVVKPQYDQIKPFSEGLAAVAKIVDGNMTIDHLTWGYIDQTGKEVLPLQFSEADSFHEGFATVNKYLLHKGENYNRDWSFINTAGKAIAAYEYDEVRPFSEGLAAVKKYGVWGFIDPTGLEVIARKYDIVGNFSEGLAVVSKSGASGFVDKTGREVIELKYNSIDTNAELILSLYYRFSNGLAIVINKDGKGVYVDRTGREVIAKKGRGFQEGIAWFYSVTGTKGSWGFMDKSGKVILQPQYETMMLDTYNFQNGFTTVVKNGKWGFVDKTGKEIVPTQYGEAMSFSEELAAVKAVGSNGNWGFIDTNGKEVIALQYELVEPFSEGLAAVKVNGKWGFIANPVHPPVSAAVTVADIPDDWAKKEVKEAVNERLIPDYLQNGYRDNITRKDFCALIVKVIEVATGKNLAMIANEKKLNLMDQPFSDTADRMVVAANKLGIVNGKGSGLFYPDGRITRQEAAVILNRTAGVIVEVASGGAISGLSVQYSEKDIAAALSSFQDKSEFADWSYNAITYVTSAGIMTGLGNDKFGPEENYTRQQAYIATLRLFLSLQ